MTTTPLPRPDVRRVGNVAILDIEGEITRASEEALGEAYAEAPTAAPARSCSTSPASST